MDGSEKFSNRILIINDKLYGPSVGTPTKSITDCIGSDQNLYTYIYDKSNKTKEIEGKKLLGKYPPITSGWFLNTTFQNLIFRKFKRLVKERSKSFLLHYASQQVKPFHFQNSTVTVHDLVPILFPSETSKLIYRLTRKNLDFYKKLPIVMTVSNFVKESLLDYGFEGKIHVIYNPVNSSFLPLNETKAELRQKLNLPSDKKLVLSVSANYPRKNLKMVEETMEILGTDYSLVRVGSPLKNSINFKNISNERLNQLYNACDIFFMPSKYEGFGLPIIEAFSSGIPVIASNIPVFREISEGSAILSPDDPKIYAEYIEEATQYPDELREFGLKRAKFFSMENYCKKLTSFYHEAFNICGIE